MQRSEGRPNENIHILLNTELSTNMGKRMLTLVLVVNM